MGNSYYYFCASLQWIDIESKPPLSVEDFLKDCERLLSGSDYHAMQTILTEKLDDSIKNQTAWKWMKFNHDLKNEAAHFRAQKANKEPMEFVRGDRSMDVSTMEAISDADKAKNPLEGEKVLSNRKWKYLDELAEEHYFDFDFLIVYGLRLKILERYQAIRSPKGKEMYEELKKIKFPKEIAAQHLEAY